MSRGVSLLVSLRVTFKRTAPAEARGRPRPR